MLSRRMAPIIHCLGNIFVFVWIIIAISVTDDNASFANEFNQTA